MRYLILIVMIAFLLCHAIVAVAQSETSMTDEEAKLMMKQAHYLWTEGNPQEAIEILEKVVAYNPRLEANFPEEKLELQAQGGLGFAYMGAKQWQNAVSAFDLAEQFAQERKSYEPTVLPIDISRCREQLSLAGTPPAEQMIVIGGWIYRGERMISDGIMLVSASELAPKLGLKITSDGTKILTLSIDADKRNVDTDKNKKLKMTVGNNTATGNNTTLQFPVPPQQGSKGIMVPLRSVVEYFGGEVKWDPSSRIIWL